MRCPFCRSVETDVVDSRPRNEQTKIWRRRKCLSCNRRFSTQERLDPLYLLVIKKDGRKEPFNKEKIIFGILKSLGKHRIPHQKIEEIADEVAQEIHKLGVSQIKSSLIGELVLARLYRLDLVAYIRFASVLKKFKDIESFREELEKLKNNKVR